MPIARATSGRRESNPRPRAWKARALPTELLPRRIVHRFVARHDGEGRIRTSEGVRRQIYSLLPLAARAPLRDRCRRMHAWSRWSESNRRPADYKSAALPPELHRRAAPRSACRCSHRIVSEILARERFGAAHRRPRREDTSPDRDEAPTDNIGASGLSMKTPAPAASLAAPARSHAELVERDRRPRPRRSATRPRRPSGCVASKSQVRRTSGRSPSPSPPDHEGRPLGRLAGRRALGAARGDEANQPEPAVFQRLHRPDQVRDAGDPEAEERSPAEARHHDRGDPDAPVLRQDHPADAGRPSRAQDRAQVARVLDRRRGRAAAGARRREHVLEVGVAERRRDRDRALMVRASRASRSSAARSASLAAARRAGAPRATTRLGARPGSDQQPLDRRAAARAARARRSRRTRPAAALGCPVRPHPLQVARDAASPMGKILHRYIFREILTPFLLGLGVFTFVLLIARLLKLIELVVNRGVPPTQHRCASSATCCRRSSR